MKKTKKELKKEFLKEILNSLDNLLKKILPKIEIGLKIELIENQEKKKTEGISVSINKGIEDLHLFSLNPENGDPVPSYIQNYIQDIILTFLFETQDELIKQDKYKDLFSENNEEIGLPVSITFNNGILDELIMPDEQNQDLLKLLQNNNIDNEINI